MFNVLLFFLFKILSIFVKNSSKIRLILTFLMSCDNIYTITKAQYPSQLSRVRMLK